MSGRQIKVTYRGLRFRAASFKLNAVQDTYFDELYQMYRPLHPETSVTFTIDRKKFPFKMWRRFQESMDDHKRRLLRFQVEGSNYRVRAYTRELKIHAGLSRHIIEVKVWAPQMPDPVHGHTTNMEWRAA